MLINLVKPQNDDFFTSGRFASSGACLVQSSEGLPQGQCPPSSCGHSTRGRGGQVLQHLHHGTASHKDMLECKPQHHRLSLERTHWSPQIPPDCPTVTAITMVIDPLPITVYVLLEIYQDSQLIPQNHYADIYSHRHFRHHGVFPLYCPDSLQAW